jgi:prepilin-type N-terminal cleavage/methylation domain-containing protein
LKFYNRGKIKGFTLIEVVISILLLSIIAISMIPMVTFAYKSSRWNSIKSTAMSLAQNQIEWLKTLNYDDLGLKGDYDPNGIVERNLYMNDENTNPLKIDAIEYKMKTNIYWKEAKSTTGEYVADAMKEVDVVVEARDVLNGKSKKYSILGTIISFEGERSPTPPGHLEVYAYWRNLDNPMKNVKIELKNKLNNSLIKSALTNDEGRAVFTSLKLNEGDYIIIPTKCEFEDMMIMPNGVKGINSNKEWDIEKVLHAPKWDPKNPPNYTDYTFYLDRPGYLRFPNNYHYPKDGELSIRPTSESFTPPAGSKRDDYTLNLSLNRLNGVKFWREWIYEYTVIDGDDIYFITDKDSSEEKEWDGSFDFIEDESTIKNIELAFGIKNLDEIKNEKIKSNDVLTFEVEFTSVATGLENMKFSFNDVIIDDSFKRYDNKNDFEKDLSSSKEKKKSYLIEPLDEGEFHRKIKIYIYPAISTYNNSKLNEFRILNPEVISNQYGIKLAKYKSEFYK